MIKRCLFLLLLICSLAFSQGESLLLDVLSSLPFPLGGEVKCENALWWENPEEKRFDGKREVVVADLKGPGIITMLHFAMPERMKLDRSLIMRIFWDDEKNPSVEVPIVDFFCDPNGTLDRVDTALVNKKRGWNAYFPMPFRKRARIVLHWDNPHVPDSAIYSYAPCYFYVMWRSLPSLPKDAFYFHAFWRQETLLLGKRDYLLLEAKGKGHLVGLNVTVRSVYPDQGYCPVDQNVKFYIDGEAKPRVEWQGMEDAFGFSYGFPPEPNFFPYTGWHPYYERGAFAYKFCLNDRISFHKSLRVAIGFGEKEHPIFRETYSQSIHPLQFSSTVYWYQNEPHNPYPSFLPYEKRLPALDAIQKAERDRKAKEFREKGITLSLRCGDPEEEVEFLEEGWDYRWREGYSFYSPTLWPGDVKHCWAGWEVLSFDIICPKGSRGVLRLFIKDADNFAGGRRQRIKVGKKDLGIFENFQEGKWVEVEISEEDTREGVISVVIENLKEGGNAVVSFIQFVRR